MGMEMLWLRHATLLLGGFRAVFSLTMTVLLAGIGAGALCGGWLHRRWQRPAETFMLVQALFVATTLAGLALADAEALQARGQVMAATLGGLAPWRRAVVELWYTAGRSCSKWACLRFSQAARSRWPTRSCSAWSTLSVVARVCCIWPTPPAPCAGRS